MQFFLFFAAVTPSYFLVQYKQRFLKKDYQFRPLHWYAVCVVVGPTALLLWLQGKTMLLEVAFSPLPLDGYLVLGQKQNVPDGLYLKSEAFSGHVTLLSLWDTALPTQDLDDWGKCRPLAATPLTDWDNLNYIIHNGSAGVNTHTNGPCNDDSLDSDKVVLITSMMNWKVTRQLMASYGMWTTKTRSFSFQEQHKALLRRFSQSCIGSPLFKKPSAWIGLLYNCFSGEVENLKGIRVNVTLNWPENYRKILEKSSCSSPRPLVVNVDGEWFWVPKTFKYCSFAEKVDTNPFINMRMHCQDGEKSVYSNLNFILAQVKLTQHNGGAMYLHGVQPYLMEDTYNNGTWCLKKRALPLATDIACTIFSQAPSGLNEWNPVGGSEVDPCSEINENHLKISYSSPLLLTTCTPEQYTCNTLQCITLDKVCDMKPDCQMGEDESNCTIIGSVKDNVLVPDMPPSFPLPMLIEAEIVKISNIDLMNFAMSMTLHVTMMWMDPRFEYHHLLPGKRILKVRHSVFVTSIFFSLTMTIHTKKYMQL